MTDHKPLRLTSIDGIELAGRDYGAGGPLCLCLHGLARNSRDFEDFAPRLASQGYRVVALDMRGRGESEAAKDPAHYNVQTYVADCLAWLDHLGADRAIWIGSSMGGGISIAAGAVAPERVSGIVLNDIAPEIDPRGVENIRKIAGKGGPIRSWEEAAERCRVVNGHVHPDETDDEFWMTFARRTHRKTGDDTFRSDYDPAILATMGKGLPARDRWKAFDLLQDIPTLLVRGELSELVTAEIAGKMRTRKPNLGYVEVPRTGHTPLLTEEIAFNAISDWLAQHKFS
ncbi:alpha/beta hydrolase [Hyphobacterium sp. HN65]|uniref:Alpha/beta hydrolase n=1 Tax=Hyphobacterium lacteum TaxID=3116575 RepID=A0ABU7LNV2_9PROT|nr:alpha/beta hydrolase [Hyphobacterium sp. HN65]MEE2525587.1 alpha/beta hydrolase [Hyphobacterium sp. HN65]